MATVATPIKELTASNSTIRHLPATRDDPRQVGTQRSGHGQRSESAPASKKCRARLEEVSGRASKKCRVSYLVR